MKSSHVSIGHLTQVEAFLKNNTDAKGEVFARKLFAKIAQKIDKETSEEDEGKSQGITSSEVELLTTEEVELFAR